jgi:hypothetical protein
MSGSIETGILILVSFSALFLFHTKLAANSLFIVSVSLPPFVHCKIISTKTDVVPDGSW